MGTIPVPTLSTSGFIETIGEKIDRLLAYFCTSEGNQSELFRNRVASLSHLVAQYGDSPSDLCDAMRDRLTRYYGNYFDNVEVNVTHEFDNKEQQAGRYSLFTDLSVRDYETGEVRHLFREIKMEGSLFKKIAIINSDGLKDKEI